MPINPSKLELKLRPVSLVRNYHQGKPIPITLYDRYLHDLFGQPFNTKAREVGHKLYGELKKFAARNSDKKSSLHNAVTPYNFLLHKALLGPVDIKEFYQRLNLVLQNRKSGIKIQMTTEQFAQLSPTFNSLNYFYGNQTLTGAPFVIGGIPRLDYFQWGNLMGIVKYVELAEERSLTANLLIYFEDMGDKTLQQCFKNFIKYNSTILQPIVQSKLLIPELPTLQQTPNPYLKFTMR